MSDFDIKKIAENELIKQWADEADKKGNNDSKFLNSAFEKEYVKYKAGEYLKDKTSKNEAIEDEVKALFGADLTNSTSVDIAKPANKSEKRDAKASQKHVTTELIPGQSKIFQELSDKTGVQDFSLFVYNIRANLFNPQSLKNLGDDKEYYSRLIGEVEVVANAMNKHNKYNSRDDIMKLYDQVKQELQLDKNDDFKDFKLAVLEQFVKIAESHQKNKETNLLNQRYHELRNGKSQEDALKELLSDPVIDAKYTALLVQHGSQDIALGILCNDEAIEKKYSELTKGMSREDAVTAIKKDPQFKGSYYHDYRGQDVNEQINNYQGSQHKGLIKKELIKGTVQGEADQAWTKAINDQRIKKVSHVTKQEDPEVPADMTKADMTKSRRVEKGAEQTIIQEEGKIDKHIKKAQKGHMTLNEKLKFERSKEKALRKEVATENRVYLNKQKAFTKDEFYSELKNDALFKALCGIGVPENKLKDHPPLLSLNETKDENGNQTYNLTNLANIIALHIGSDGIANRQTGELKRYSEVKNTITTIAANLGISNISDHDIKNLIRLCGFEVEGKNWVRIFYNAVVSTAVDSLVGLASALGVSATSTAIASIAGSAAVNINSVNVTGYNGGPVTAEFDYNKTFIDQIINNNEVNFDFNIAAEGMGGIKWANEDDFWLDHQDLDPQSVTIQSTENGLQIGIHTTDTTIVNLVREINEKLTKVYEKLDELGIDWSKFDVDVDASADISNLKAQIDSIDQKTKIANAMIYSSLISFVLNFIQEALKEYNEDIPLISTTYDAETVEDYSAALDVMFKDKPKLAQGFKALAGAYIEKDPETGKDIVETDKDGNKHYKWNKQEYYAFLNKLVAGNGSFANKYEVNSMISRIDDIKAELARIKITKKPENIEGLPFDGGEQKPAPKVENLKLNNVQPLENPDPGLEVKREVTPIELKPIAFTRWNDVVSGYSCLQKPEFAKTKMKSGASLSNRIVKVIQAISAQEGDDAKSVYNVRTIADFAVEADKIGLKNKAKLQELANSEKFAPLKIDVDKYCAIVGSDVGMTKGVLAPPLFDPNDAVDGNDGVCSHDGHQGAPLKQNELGGKGHGVDVQQRTIDGEVKYFERTVGEGDDKWRPSDKATYEKYTTDKKD